MTYNYKIRDSGSIRNVLYVGDDDHYWEITDHMSAAFSADGGSSFDSMTYINYYNSTSYWYNSPYSSRGYGVGVNNASVKLHA